MNHAGKHCPDSMDSAPDSRLFQPTLECESAFGGADEPGPSFAIDLFALVRLVETSHQACERLRHTSSVASSHAAQRDLLHMQARIAGIRRQVGDAIATFNRLQDRFRTESARGRQVPTASLPDRDARIQLSMRPSGTFIG